MPAYLLDSPSGTGDILTVISRYFPNHIQIFLSLTAMPSLRLSLVAISSFVLFAKNKTFERLIAS
jgi:hypothetical protein